MLINTVSTGTTLINDVLQHIGRSLVVEKREETNVCPKCGGEGQIFYRDAQNRLFVKSCPVCRSREKERIKNALKRSGIPNAFGRDVDLAPEVEDYARRFKRYGFSDWLVLTGKPGTGKTTQAAQLAKRVVFKGAKVRFYNAFTLTRRLMANRKRADVFANDFDEFRDADLVVLDDFLKGVPQKTSFEFNDFYSATCELVWTRYDDRKPLVITTQKKFNDVALFDSALASRIVEMGKGRFITLGGAATNYRLGR